MSLVALETAQIGKLKGSPTYAAKVKGTYSMTRPEGPNPLPDSVFPYVVFGTTGAGDGEYTTHDAECEDSNTTVHIWSRYKGKKEVYEIFALMKTLLHRQSLSLPGSSRVVRMRLRLVSVFQDPDGKTMHGVVRIITETQ